MDKNKVLELISKLTALSSTDSGAFQGEIANASAKVQELMDKYSISQMDIHNYQADKQEKEFKEEFTSNSSSIRHPSVKKWHWDLARLISRATHTRNYTRGNYMTFFGASGNSEIASALYVLWLGNISKMADEANKKHRRDIIRKYGDRPGFFKWVSLNYPEDDPRFFRQSWITGCIDGMNENVRIQEKERKPEQENAISLYNRDVMQAYKDMIVNGSRTFKRINVTGSKGFTSSGYSKGREAGSSIHIGAQPVSSGGKKLLKG